MLRRALFIAYHFPPTAGSGVFRVLKFSKFLPEFEWAIHVLTPRAPIFSPKDPSLCGEIPHTTRVTRTSALSTESLVKRMLNMGKDPKWIFLPDPAIGWLPFALFEGLRLIRREKFDLIYSTAPFYSSMLIGFILSLLSRIPLILDYRDPWTERDDSTYPTRLHLLVDRVIELVCNRRAHILIAATPSLAKRIKNSWNLPAEKVRTILNGYDPADFEGIQRESVETTLTITHIGNLYRSSLPHVFLLMKVLSNIISRGEMAKSDVRLRLVGSYPRDEVQDLASDLGIEDIVDDIGYVSYKESIAMMVNSSVLLLVNPSWSKGLEIPQKLYNYLGSGRPILAIVRPGDAVDVIQGYEGITVVNPDDPEQVELAVIGLYKAWKTRSLPVHLHRDMSRYLRVKQAEELAELLNATCS